MKIPSVGCKLFMISWEVTSKCNLRCIYCYRNYNEFHEKENDPTLIKKILKEISSIPSIKIISITGGEPTLSPFLKDIVKTLYNFNKYIGITTNGNIKEREKLASFLKKYKKMLRVQVSIEGDKKVHEFFRGRNSFDEAILTVKYFSERGIPVSLMMTAFKSNLEKIRYILKLQKKLGADFVAIERFVPTGIGAFLKNELISREDFHFLIKKVKRLQKEGNRIYLNDPIFEPKTGFGCSAGIYSLAISSNGLVYPCSKLRIPIGNIKHKKLSEIWKNSKLLKKLRNRINLKGKCYRCIYRDTCGGCRALAYALSKNIFAEDPLCPISY